QCSDGKICSNRFCVPCPDDDTCADEYGPAHLCINGVCPAGQCHVATDCQPGKICSPTLTCTACSTDAQCVSGYGANHLCVGGECISGDCRTNADCTAGGRICDTAKYTCTSCSTDAACVTA